MPHPYIDHRIAWGLAAAIAIAVVVAVVLLMGDESDDAPEGASTTAERLFSSDSVWNTALSDTEPIDPASESLIQSFAAQIERERAEGIGPWIQTGEGSTPLYTVPADQPTVRVQLEGTAPSYEELQEAMGEVPIPSDATPAAGTDGHMTVYQPATDTLWEFWQARLESDGWHATWGGAMNDVSDSPGYYTEDSFPGASWLWGSTASSLPVIGGTIMVDELEAGEIDHALALDIPDARGGSFAWPAQRTDGTGGEDLLPEGAKLRIDPALDLDSLGLSPAGLVIATAAQEYGIIVRDVTHHATAFYAQDPTPLGEDPYPELFGGKIPSEVLEGFPWEELQVMRMSLCTSGPCTPPATG